MHIGSGIKRRTALASVLMVGVGGVVLASPVAASPHGGTGTIVTAVSTQYGSILEVGGTGPLAGAPLYLFSGDARGKFGCTADLVDTGQGPISCTGPESDALNGIQTDDWPALTTIGRPVAGHGVDGGLLGSVNRPGIGYQVTYAGHPLYLFDGPSDPFAPFGEAFLETVAPLPPWHGVWYLVSAHRGVPAPGVATITTETLPDGTPALGGELLPSMGGATVTVYSFSGDHRHGSDCTGSCAVLFMPVITSGTPQVSGGIEADDVGVINRSDGSHQVTYQGKPLYFYSAEQVVLGPTGPSTNGTAGNGDGVSGPHGGTFSVVTPS